MRPLPISADTAVKLAKELRIPLEQLMHMPQAVLLQKMAEMAKREAAAAASTEQVQKQEQNDPNV